MFSEDNLYSIYDYRKYTGYYVKNKTATKECEILCVGTCDLSSIRDSEIFDWSEILGKNNKTYSIGLLIPFEYLIGEMESYLKNNPMVKVVCFNVPIHSYLYEGNKFFGITRNSKRVIKYLQVKKVFNDIDSTNMYELQKKCENISRKNVIEYYNNCFSKIEKLKETYKFDFFWMFNPTKTMNSFVENYDLKHYNNIGCLGYVENIDSNPDSSMGSLTQKEVAKKYETAILARS